MQKFAIAAALAAAISSVSAPPAVAQEAQVPVRYGDLDTASPTGIERLGARIDAGADTVCGRPDVRDINANVEFKACKQAVVASTVEQLASKGIQVQLGD